MIAVGVFVLLLGIFSVVLFRSGAVDSVVKNQFREKMEYMGIVFDADVFRLNASPLELELKNATFNDHYLEVDFDLSNVMFVTTANTLNIPPALLDRMEVIRLAGYTEDEKREIARQHLLPKQVTANGLRKGEFSVTDEALTHVIRYYTREAGGRSLEREIAKLARKADTLELRGGGACHGEAEAAFGAFDQPFELIVAQDAVRMALQIGERREHEAVLERRAALELKRFEE